MYLMPVKYPTPGFVAFFMDDAYEAGSRSAEWAVDDVRCNRMYSNKVKAACDSPLIGPLTLLSGVGVRLGDTYKFPLFSAPPIETDTGSFLRSIKVDQDSEDNKQWMFTLTYEPFDIPTLLGTTYIDQGIIDPRDRAWEVFWAEAQKYDYYRPTDYTKPTAKPYLNTAGDPLLDPPKNEETRPVFCLIRNESIYDDTYATQFKDTVNSDIFMGFAPETVKCKDIKGERIFDADWGWYHKVTYLFEFRDDPDHYGFKLRIPSWGYREKKGGTGNPVNVTDGKGNVVTDAVGLQSDGRYTPGSDPYIMTFEQYPQVAFADLNIPDDLFYVASGGM